MLTVISSDDNEEKMLFFNMDLKSPFVGWKKGVV